MIRVFVGTDGDFQQDAEKVLEWSIRKNTKEEVDVTFMRPGWKTGCTGFSTHRYLIPELCEFQGYAIYFDVDMLVLGDLTELMSYKLPGKWTITKRHEHKTGIKHRWRDEVSVIDCSAFKAILPTSSELRRENQAVVAATTLRGYYSETIPRTWNAKILTPEAKLIHYTNLRTQPWHPDPTIDYTPFPCEKTCALFFEYLKEANKYL